MNYVQGMFSVTGCLWVLLRYKTDGRLTKPQFSNWQNRTIIQNVKNCSLHVLEWFKPTVAYCVVIDKPISDVQSIFKDICMRAASQYTILLTLVFQACCLLSTSACDVSSLLGQWHRASQPLFDGWRPIISPAFKFIYFQNYSTPADHPTLSLARIKRNHVTAVTSWTSGRLRAAHTWCTPEEPCALCWSTAIWRQTMAAGR